MEKNIQVLLLIIGCMFCALASNAQTYPPVARVYGASPFQDSLWSLDPDISGLPVDGRFAPFLPGFTITGMTGLAFDPCGFKSYIILKVSGVTGRVLATLNLSTMECTQVGNLGDNFSSLCFDRNGQLFGLTGNGAAVPEALYSIDKFTGAKTLLTALGNGADGEILSYDPITDMFYHWSGNGTVVYEKFANVAPYTVIPISSGAAGGEIFGALYWGPNQFLLSTIASNFRLVDTLGNYSGPIGSNPDDLRGLIMPPVFAANKSEVCPGIDTVSIASDAADLFSAIYHWGDGSIDTLVSGIASHVYATSGTYSISVELNNGYCTPDTFWTTSILVKNSPLVSLSGNTVICTGDSVLLTGSSGGTSQWYINGLLIPGATSPSYYATISGWYNMVKTNLNGCSDSAATGIDITNGLTPFVSLGNDTTVCGTLLLDAQNAGSSYSWNTNDTTQTLLVTSSGNYWVLVTDTSGCAMSDTIDVVINALPIVLLSGTSTICSGDSTLLTGSSGGTSQWYWDGFAIPGATSNTYYATQAGIYNMIKNNSNGCSDSASAGIQIVVNSLPIVTLSGTNSICQGSSSVLTGSGGGTSQWYLNGVSIPGATSPSYTATLAGIYNMIKTNNNGCFDSAAIGITLTVLPMPIVTYVEQNDTLCNHDGIVALTPGSPVGGVYIGPYVTGSSFDATQAGPGNYMISYVYTDSNGCVNSDSSLIVVKNCTGITENEVLANSIIISPNPIADFVSISFDTQGSLVNSLRIFNSVGKLVYEQVMPLGKLSLDVGHLQSGLYQLQIQSGKNLASKKVIIIH
jgi:hypothetical protein